MQRRPESLLQVSVKMLRAAVVLAAVHAAATAGCDAPAPLGVTPLVSLGCATPGASLNFLYDDVDPNTGGYFTLNNTALCITARQQSDGSFALAVAQCFYPQGSADELYAPLPDGTWVSHTNGLCVDTEQGANQSIGLHACTAGPGQQWRLDEQGRLINGWGFCAGTC